MRNSPRKNKGFQGWYLRNAVPARGRKPHQLFRYRTGKNLRNAVPARGRKPLIITLKYFLELIWEMQSPQGDGNQLVHISNSFRSVNLRNAVPARGRKHIFLIRQVSVIIWEMQSPQGDGNYSFHQLGASSLLPNLRNAVPARGRKLVITPFLLRSW